MKNNFGNPKIDWVQIKNHQVQEVWAKQIQP